MAPTWEELADEWKDHKVGLIAEVDCTQEEELCEEYGVQGFPTLLWGDPLTPEPYEGQRSYEALSTFAKEHISEPYCSIYNKDVCSEEEKSTIEDLQKKSREDLEEIDAKVHLEISEEQEKFDQAVEEINNQYEATVNHFNQRVDEIRDAVNHKWVKQLLVTMMENESAEL
jgi:thiol-disulfide isomerase/thioredoxin